MFKEQSIAILKKHCFTVVIETDDGKVYMDSLGEEYEGVPIIQVILYPNENGIYLIDIGGYYHTPIVGYERELIQYLNRYHPGWEHLID